LHTWILPRAFSDFGSRGKYDDILQAMRLCSESVAQQANLRVVGVRSNHRRELRLVIKRRAVVEDDRGEWVRQHIHACDRHASHLDNAAQRVALAASLDAEEADGVGLVQVERDLPASRVAE